MLYKMPLLMNERLGVQLTITPLPLDWSIPLAAWVSLSFFKYAAFIQQPQSPAFSGRGAAWRELQDLAVRLGLPTR